MTLTLNQLASLLEALAEIQDTKMSFKLSMLLAKNLNLLQKEVEFYTEQEREFANRFFVVDEETQEFKQVQPNVFMIKEGMQEECASARKELDGFTVDVNLRMIPVTLIENMEFTPKQLSALEMLIEDETKEE